MNTIINTRNGTTERTYANTNNLQIIYTLMLNKLLTVIIIDPVLLAYTKDSL